MKNMNNVHDPRANKIYRNFVENLESNDFKLCDCLECLPFNLKLFIISHKVALALELDEQCIGKDEYNIFISSIAVTTACSLLNPMYFAGLCEWNDTGLELIENSSTNDEMFLIYSLICQTWENLDDEERRMFGTNFRMIMNLDLRYENFDLAA